MPKRLSEETKTLMRNLYNKGFLVADIAKEVNVSYSLVWVYTKKGSFGEYRKHLAKQRGYTSYIEYLVKRHGFDSYKKFKEHWAKQKGFDSYKGYADYRTKERQKKPLNQKISSIIKNRLKDLGKSQKWLAKEIKVTEGAVSRYISGKTLPKNKLQQKLFEVLELPYQTLEDFL